ncbi:MAG: GDP-L-fucose synthase [Planctomycetota bacterium]|nr:MAG: GDP-L-fucose synthase [Planctomycetota bacterium]
MSVNWSTARVIVTGGGGFLGSRVVSVLRGCGVEEDRIHIPHRATCDLTDATAVERMYEQSFDGAGPTMVIHLAAEVGGIGANRENPGRYFFANMAMALHLIEGARRAGLHDRGGKFVQVGTICSYPKFTPVPFREEELWNGYPEETNAPYGIAKKAAGEMLRAYHDQYGLEGAYVLPVNLYGPGDNFDPQSSHVIPALIRKCVEARDRGDDSIEVWGTGSASREFLYVEDAAAGIVRAAEIMTEPVPINLGTCSEITIRDLVELIARLTGFRGELRWDASKPDGQPRRCLDVSRARALLGWQAQVGFEDGLKRTIDWWEQNRTT